ncbi:methyltransferase protein 7B-like [Tropilaelaps mercedesae]|uniref:Methyltransferase protein 7B-like n=1 Tax=Tropilaelaps mercedesae TaxID=418985 RepID=A0A1V9X3J1_9ACAR|nr:methyltransferase protein 7B-like [Tropilaelaps mercedesae]
MNAIIYFVKSYLLSDRYRYDPEIYWTMDAYKRDLFWNLKAICHSKGSISEPVDVRLNVDNINLTLATQERLQSNTDLDELRILEVCVNPILTSNYKHFPYWWSHLLFRARTKLLGFTQRRQHRQERFIIYIFRYS